MRVLCAKFSSSSGLTKTRVTAWLEHIPKFKDAAGQYRVEFRNRYAFELVGNNKRCILINRLDQLIATEYRASLLGGRKLWSHIRDMQARNEASKGESHSEERRAWGLYGVATKSVQVFLQEKVMLLSRGLPVRANMLVLVPLALHSCPTVSTIKPVSTVQHFLHN